MLMYRSNVKLFDKKQARIMKQQQPCKIFEMKDYFGDCAAFSFFDARQKNSVRCETCNCPITFHLSSFTSKIGRNFSTNKKQDE